MTAAPGDSPSMPDPATTAQTTEGSAPETRPRTIADRLRSEILRGAYREGERLPAERELAARLDANRGAVREALRMLEQSGLVSVRRGGGATVQPLRDASVEIVRHLLFADGTLDLPLAVQVIDVHEMLLAGASRLAVERGSDEQLERAGELLRALVEAEAEDERLRLLDRLYALVTEASGNLVLRLVRNTLGPIVAGELRQYQNHLRPPRAELEPQVDAILAGIAARDATATEEAVRALLRDRRERLLKILDASPEADGASAAAESAPTHS